MKQNINRHYLLFLAAVFFSLFCFNLFKHISYPLLWNDESYGAMNALRVLEYGYPKVHDEKGNVVFEPHKGYDLKPIYNAKYDIQTYIPWGNEYFSAIGVLLSKLTQNIYQKTALVRIPFAMAAVLAMVLFMFAIRDLFDNKNHYYLALVLFLLMETCSVPFILHMREARYYSLIVLIQAVLIYQFTRNILSNSNKTEWKYVGWTALLFFIAYHINYPLFYILTVSWIATHAVFLVVDANLHWHRPRKENINTYMLAISPVCLALLFVLPFEILIFKTFKTSQLLGGKAILSSEYFSTLGNMVKIFILYEWFSIGLIFKIAFLAMFFFRSKMHVSVKSEYNRLFFISIFLNCIFFSAILSVSRSSYTIFSRYVIPFQPVMVLAAVLEGYIFLKWLFVSSYIPKVLKWSFVTMLTIIFALTISMQFPMLKGRVHELRFPYKGPLDFIIPYIIDNYKNPDKLIIATDYESTSYMFYLNSRVLIGFIPLHLKDDLRYTPDILIYRKLWLQDPTPFQYFMSKAKYNGISFPVFDYPVNYIPELYLGLGNDIFTHQFATVYTNDPLYQASIFVKR